MFFWSMSSYFQGQLTIGVPPPVICTTTTFLCFFLLCFAAANPFQMTFRADTGLAYLPTLHSKTMRILKMRRDEARDRCGLWELVSATRPLSISDSSAEPKSTIFLMSK
ncbi:hypothetical protein BT96DRAFT_722434 [Gymnopus androsaceus JB14]|uniref:Uncharacterized protein n=1 Tax=Gymnopus androsaceus JB14 TaxID=1447944 RepID=A0A6A4HKT3_9AGAR|nr:hypothetical protein BT96DRAFT_722434 [Gymnopus androsaceus JB14]